MLWIVQNNLYNEVGYQKLLNALQKFDLNYQIVRPVPFTSIILPEDFDSVTQNIEDVEEPYIDTNQKIIVFGTLTLTRIAKERGWNPGAYINSNFDFKKWNDGFGSENILNADAKIGKLYQMLNPNIGDEVFVRPTEDTKSFSGMVISKHYYDDWIASILNIEESSLTTLHRNTNIIVSSIKKIYAEYRMFIVNNKVVTGSLYKRGNQVIYDSLVPDDVFKFSQDMVDKWSPHEKGFVLDIADTPDGLKVLEINNINSTGFYETNVQKIVCAIEEMEGGVE